MRYSRTQNPGLERYRYARTVFVTPPWKEIFENDAERGHSFEDALRQYPEDLAAYREASYSLIEIPRGPLRERVDFIAKHVAARSRLSSTPC